MHLIEFENYEVRPTQEFFLIKPLRDLYKKYYEKDWEKFMQYVSFIYHYVDPRSSYAYLVDDDDRFHEIVIQEGLPKDFKITKELRECIEHYKARLITPSQRLLQRSISSAEKLGIFLDGIDLNERDDKGRAVYSPGQITQAIRQVPQLIKDLIEMEKTVAAEIEEAGKIRGGYEKSVFDDGIKM